MENQHLLALELAYMLLSKSSQYTVLQVEISGREEDRAYLTVRNNERNMEISIRDIGEVIE